MRDDIFPHLIVRPDGSWRITFLISSREYFADVTPDELETGILNGGLRFGESWLALSSEDRKSLLADIDAYRVQIRDIPSGESPGRSFPLNPPKAAEHLLHMLLPHEKGEALIGDLLEEFEGFVVPEFGLTHAKVWYWSQAFRSVGRYALVGFVVEHLRRWFVQG